MSRLLRAARPLAFHGCLLPCSPQRWAAQGCMNSLCFLSHKLVLGGKPRTLNGRCTGRQQPWLEGWSKAFFPSCYSLFCLGMHGLAWLPLPCTGHPYKAQGLGTCLTVVQCTLPLFPPPGEDSRPSLRFHCITYLPVRCARLVSS